MEIVVWACPTPNCGNYYASSSAGDLTFKPNRRSSMRNLAGENPRNWGETTFYRDQCPDCKLRGLNVHRVPIGVEVDATPYADSGAGHNPAA